MDIEELVIVLQPMDIVKVSTTTNGYWRHWWRLVLQPMDIEDIGEG